MQINRNFLSPNHSNRTKKIEYIIVHFTEMTFEDALTKLTDKNSGVSAHYLIKEDGEIFQLVDNCHIAWHAGKSLWQGKDALNQNSIGIEIDNLGDRKFTDAQMESCIKLCQFLMKKYDVPTQNFIGHSDVAPERKIDPGIFFDWRLCAQKGLGIHHDLRAPKSSKILFKFGNSSGQVKKLQSDLKKIGYPVTDTGKFDQQTNFIIRAFQAKFYPEIIKKKGLNFYQDNKSRYFWDSFSERILQKILRIRCK